MSRLSSALSLAMLASIVSRRETFGSDGLASGSPVEACSGRLAFESVAI